MPAPAAFVLSTMCNICIGPDLERKVMQALFRRRRSQPQSLSCFISSRCPQRGAGQRAWREERGDNQGVEDRDEVEHVGVGFSAAGVPAFWNLKAHQVDCSSKACRRLSLERTARETTSACLSAQCGA